MYVHVCIVYKYIVCIVCMYVCTCCIMCSSLFTIHTPGSVCVVRAIAAVLCSVVKGHTVSSSTALLLPSFSHGFTSRLLSHSLPLPLLPLLPSPSPSLTPPLSFLQPASAVLGEPDKEPRLCVRHPQVSHRRCLPHHHRTGTAILYDTQCISLNAHNALYTVILDHVQCIIVQ